MLDSIALSLPAIAASGEGPQLLKDIQQDEIDPRRSPRQSAGRNAQFHLYLASIFLSAGYEVRLEGPDLLVHGEFGHAQIAAKRILRSENRIRGRFRAAAGQLKPNHGLGVIALDVSNLLSPGGAYVPSGVECR